MEKMKKAPSPRIDKTGFHYGHWVVKGQDLEASEKLNKIMWICECDCGCGTTKSLTPASLYQIKVGGCDNMKMSIIKTCAKCGKEFSPKKQAKTRRYCYDCYPEMEVITGAKTRKLIKQWALEYKGNQCSICGYNKCSEALEFHHTDPNQKDFSISDRDIKLDWEQIKKELDKCILVCSNCHREIHAKENKNET